MKKNKTLNLNGESTFLIKQPELIVDGKITFEDFYMLHPPTIYTDGSPTTLTGKISLKIYVSDEYTIALPYKFNSPINVDYEMALMEFDEISSLTNLLPYIIIIAIIIIPIFIIHQSKGQSSKNKVIQI